MKKFIPYIACGLLLISGWACTRTDDLDVVGVEQGKIVIRTALDPQVETRAVADESAERKITRIDVVVVDPATGNIVHREVHTNADGLNNFSEDNGNGTLSLQKERNTFVEDKAYNIYLIANASAAIATKIADTTATTTLDDLKRLVQEDYTSTTANGVTTFSTLLHLSGTTTPQATAPQTFLMDAVVTQSKESEVRDIVLYDGVQTNNTSVYAEFKRAAAKVIINIKQGSSVEFKRTLSLTADENGCVATMGDAQYEFYNLPTETKVLAEGYDLGRDNNTLIETELITIPESGSYPTFVWKDDVGSVAADGTGDVKVQIVGYADAHEWANASTLNYEPSLLLNLPIMWDANKDADKAEGDGKETARGGNWYKVPLSQNKVFERNTCYIVNITINAIGAESKSEAIELDDIDYDTRPWDVTEIKIGGDSERPKYLKLNTDLVTMYNTNIDTEQLVFSSSSPITSIVLKDVYRHDLSTGSIVAGAGTDMAAYYLNKYSVPIALDQLTQNTISATAEWGELNGKITILSPIKGTTPEERRIALEALGDEPVLPEEEPDVTGKPELSNYVPKSESRPDDLSNGAQYTVYQYNASTNTIQSMTYTYSSGGLFGWGAGWSSGSWTDMANPQEYEDALADWLENHPEYRAYQEALEKYQAYNAAESAITASANAGETHHNTIRYLEFEVRNADGLTETFRVEQYPVIYVQNSLGWYSYRDDFKTPGSENHATTYHIKGDNYDAIQYSNGTYELTSGSSISGDFWYSKVSGSPEQSHQGTATWSHYYWNSNSVSTNNSDSNENTRMYHIRVTTTSGDYTIGVPKRVKITQNINYNGTTVAVTYDTTEDSDANAKLVSPSFMTASRLGVVTSDNIDYSNSSGDALEQERYNLFSYHCSNYVEVKQVVVDGVTKKVVYDDWRLPTEEEIKIIIKLQPNGSSDNTEDKAIDYLLNAQYYYSASGRVENDKNNSSGTSVRCVRDAVDEPAPKDLTSE